jgi:hypothetical protein
MLCVDANHKDARSQSDFGEKGIKLKSLSASQSVIAGDFAFSDSNAILTIT